MVNRSGILRDGDESMSTRWRGARLRNQRCGRRLLLLIARHGFELPK
jgi:hypothetical protein